MADVVIPSRKILTDIFKNPDLVRRVEELFRLSGETLPQLIQDVELTIQNVVNQTLEETSLINQSISEQQIAPKKFEELRRELKKLRSEVDLLDPKTPDNKVVLDWVKFNIHATTSDYAGVMRWNEQDRCLEYVTGIGNVVQVGQEIWDNGVNKTGGTAADGKCIYKTGAVGSRFTYDYADARDGAKCSFVGLVTDSTDNNQEGPVTFWGLVHDVDTSAWADGTKLYIAADTTGNLTSTAPSAPDFRIWVATVLYSHVTQGILFVAPRLDYDDGVTLNDLHIRDTLTSGDITGGDYLELESTGFLETHGDGRNWDDVYPSAVSVGRGASAPSFTAYTGNFLAPEFVGAATAKNVTLHFQIYHSYDEGSDVNLHLHLYIPNDGTGGDIKFSAEYQWANVGDTGAYSSSTASNTVTIGAAAGVYQNYLFDLTDITGTGKEISSILSVVLTRDPTDVADTFGSSVWLLSADLHIHKNTLGSRQEMTK